MKIINNLQNKDIMIRLANENYGLLIESDKQECMRCNRTTNDKTGICRCNDLKLIKHHISYFPEIIIKICNDCHDDIHSSSWGAPTDESGNIDFKEFDEDEDYSSPNKKYILYAPDDRDFFYSNKEEQKTDKYGNKKIEFIDGINPSYMTLKTGIGVGICMKCGLPSCSYHGCFVENHNCNNKKMLRI